MKSIYVIIVLMLCLAFVSCKGTSGTGEATTAFAETTMLVETTSETTMPAETVSETTMSFETEISLIETESEMALTTESSRIDETEPDILPPEEVEGEAFICDEWMGAGFLTEDYILYHDYDGRLRIFDVASKRDLIYCFDPGCEHKRALEPEDGCISYNFTTMTVMIQGDNMYFVDHNGDVVRSDCQGRNRRVIGRYPPYIPGRQFTFSEEAMFSSYFSSYELLEVNDNTGNTRWIVGERKEKDTAGVIQVSLSDGTVTEIFQREDYSAKVFYSGVRGGHLYFAYIYSEMPYMSPDGKMATEIPEEWKGLSVEEYLEEFNKRYWLDIYDYDIHSGELKPVVKEVRPGYVSFFPAFFSVFSAEENKTTLYRYNGKKMRELDGVMTTINYSDSHLIGVCDGEYRMIDENNGEVLKRLETSKAGSLSLDDCIGESYYGNYVDGGVRRYFYISAEDFWNGIFENAVYFNVE